MLYMWKISRLLQALTSRLPFHVHGIWLTYLSATQMVTYNANRKSLVLHFQTLLTGY